MFDQPDEPTQRSEPPRPAPTAAEIDAIEGPLASLAGLANAVTGQLVVLVADAIETEVWGQAGIRSPEHWLAWKTGMTLRRARKIVTLARRHAELPATIDAMRSGSLSEDQAVEIGLHVPAEHEAAVADFARSATAGQVRTVARTYPFTPEPEDQDEPEPAPDPDPDEVVERNILSFGFGEDGRWRCHADLDADLGALVQTALHACRDAEFHDRHPDADPNGPTTGVTWGDALVRFGDAALSGLVSDRPAADRHQVILHVRADRPDAATHLHLGPALPAGARRYLSCDSTVRWLLEDARGVPLALGRRQRTFSAPQRTLIEELHGGECARPGCQRRRGLHLHHHVHWEDGGPTDIGNALPLCGRDHRLHHQGLLGISGDPTRPETLVFTDHHGRVLTRGAEPRPPDPDRGPDESARHLGLPEPEWEHPTGERLDRWSISFHDPYAA